MSAPQVGAGIGIANLPNQRHKIVAKRGAGFTLMVCGESPLSLLQSCRKGASSINVCRKLTTLVLSCLINSLLGESGLGKTTFINTLFTTTIKPPKNHKRRFNKSTEKTVEIEIIRAGRCCRPQRLPSFCFLMRPSLPQGRSGFTTRTQKDRTLQDHPPPCV